MPAAAERRMKARVFATWVELVPFHSPSLISALYMALQFLRKMGRLLGFIRAGTNA